MEGFVIKKRLGAIDMTKGPALKAILYFSFPLFVGNVFQQLYNVIDSVIVGNYVGAGALASVGVCFPIIFTMFSLFFGIGSGTSVMVSQYCGAQDGNRVERTIKTAYSVVLVGCIPLSIAGVLLSENILRLIQVPPDILNDAADYLRIYFLASFANLGFGVNDGILRGLGDSKSSLRFLSISCIVNVVLDLVFVLLFDWAVIGVAVATVIAQTVSWVMSMAYIRKNYLPLGTRLLRFAPDKEIFIKICKIGIPTGVQHAIFSFGTIVMQTLINGFGSDFIAGFNAASKVDMFAFMPIQSFASAAAAFVGQNVGAKQYKRIHSGVFSVMKTSLLADIFIIGLILCFGTQLLRLFNQEPEVINTGLSYLYRIMPFYLIYTITSLMHATLRGIGDTVIPTCIMIGALWLGRVPAAYLFACYLGSENLFFCYGAGWLIELLLLGIYYRSGRWKRGLISQ